ncbi:MAG: hypothetical protein PHF51_02175 [Candidatus ainarchaeum sp.]|nr:hypothetical protein [Candidatus ainarchaeum sp.]
MNPGAKAVFFVLAFSIAAIAAAMDTREFNFTVSQVPGLISVSSDANTTGLLPGFEYNYTLEVRWAVPGESLRAISASEVSVYILAEPANDSRQFYFRKGSVKVGRHYAKFTCLIENSSCSGASVLSKSIPVYYVMEAGSNRTSDRIVVQGSLEPFANESVVREANSLAAELLSKSLAPSQYSQLYGALAEMDQGDYDSALSRLGELLAAVQAQQSIPSAAAQDSSQDNWLLLFAVLAAFAILLAYYLLSRRKGGDRGGFHSLEDDEIRGSDYGEEAPAPPDEAPSPPTEKEDEGKGGGGEPPVVVRIPDWM